MGKFKHLDVPRQWTETFTKYPHGLTIFEALVDWTSQVDKMVDNVNDWNDYLDGFVENFEFELQEEVQSTITKWQNEGLLDGIIESALNTELDIVKAQLAQTDNMTSVPNTLWEEFEEREVNIKWFGAVGDGVTDDYDAIERAVEYVYNNNGGTIYFPNGNYLVSKPIILKSPSEYGGYTPPLIELKGEGNTSTTITKVSDQKFNNINATVIPIRGSTMNIEDSLSGIKFNNIKIENNSTENLTYALYCNKISRLIAEYAAFSTPRENETKDTHDRYAVYLGSNWATSFRDCTFTGDYGFYQAGTGGSCTSTILENCFVGTDKIGYHLVGVYSTATNIYGDFCNGTFLKLYFSEWYINYMGAESPDVDTLIHCHNSHNSIENAFVFQPNGENARVLYLHGSKLKINNLMVRMGTKNKGYLFQWGSSNNLTIDTLDLNGGGKFKYHEFDKLSSHHNSYHIGAVSGRYWEGVELLNKVPEYSDWFMETPKYRTQTIATGMKTPTENDAGEDLQWVGNARVGDVFINSSPLDKLQVFGWTRVEQTGTSLRSGTNLYVPFILSGPSLNRPTGKTVVGMMYFDTTLGKPIWWNGSTWVDANGVDV